MNTNTTNIAVFTYGRFQPVHKKHGMLIQTVVDIAKEYGGTPFIFTSHKHNNFKDYTKSKAYMNSKEFKRMTINTSIEDPNAFVSPETFVSTKHNENPLKPDYKIKLLHKLYDDVFEDIPKPCCIVDNINNGPFSAFHHMKSLGYNTFIMVVGKDREDNFRNAFKKNDKNISVIGLERPEETYSGTKLRHLAIQGDRDALREAMGDKMTNKDVDDLIKEIREGVTVPENNRTEYIKESMKKSKSKNMTSIINSKTSTQKKRKILNSNENSNSNTKEKTRKLSISRKGKNITNKKRRKRKKKRSKKKN